MSNDEKRFNDGRIITWDQVCYDTWSVVLSYSEKRDLVLNIRLVCRGLYEYVISYIDNYFVDNKKMKTALFLISDETKHIENALNSISFQTKADKVHVFLSNLTTFCEYCHKKANEEKEPCEQCGELVHWCSVTFDGISSRSAICYNCMCVSNELGFTELNMMTPDEVDER